ncbi:hypothetical protein TNIN_446801 [Trichonephila inaurata madagascariensis]|uniref:Uncharacterized protein n=1 Tax=Trichonephila inaurata madagascariensis TaxID=2747483 RepID=A0A8X6XYY8_9ARAC|nr:hypothetical protein TNIN_446801 [Trichonephila inaurata madagascariensis]
MKHMSVDKPVCMMFAQTIKSSRLSWSFSTTLVSISTPGLSPDESMSQVTVQTESRLITPNHSLSKTGILGIMLYGPFCGS